jgi:uncharacterized membrane protein
MNHSKSFKERFFQALAFETLAILICAPVGAWLLDISLVHTGVLTLLVSLLAMIWNVIFNLGFDRLQRRLGFKRGLLARLAHAILFEAGLILVAVPVAAWWLEIGLLEALLLDFSIVLFFLPYTFVFNLVYDKVRANLLSGRVRSA